MDTEILVKIVWGAMLLLFFVASRVKRSKQGVEPTQDAEDGEIQPMPMDLDTIFGSKPTSESSSDSQSRDVSPAEERVVRTERFERVERAERANRVAQPSHQAQMKPRVQTSIEEPKSTSVREDFDLRKAVIAAEILTPKFKDQ